MYRTRPTRGSKHKPTKGFNMFRRQARRAEANRKFKKTSHEHAVEKTQITDYVRKQWAKLRHWYWKRTFLSGKYTPHDGPQARARRVRQMKRGVCIDPVAIRDYRNMRMGQ